MKPYKIDLSGFTGKVREVVSEAVQKKAFELGWGWKRELTPVSTHHSECPVLYLEDNGVLLKDDGIDNYSHDPNTAITADAFLSLESAEPEFKAFDKVLVRDYIDEGWDADLFVRFNTDSERPFRCVGSVYKYCIPYEGNEHLLGTTDSK